MSLQPNSLLEDHPGGSGDLNAIINGNWTKINNYVNPGANLTARLDDDTPPGIGNVVNSSGDVFTSDDVGATIFFLTDRLNYVIATVSSGTKCTVTTTGELTAQPFILYRLGEVERTVLARGLSKRAQLGSSFDKKVLRYDNTHTRFNFENYPDYNVTLGRVIFGGGTNADPTSSADLSFDDSLDILDTPRVRAGKHFDTGLLNGTTDANDGAITFDFNQEQFIDINTLQAALTIASANLAAGRWLHVRIVCDGTLRNLTFPGGWVFVGSAAPASIAASKTGLLSLRSYGTTDANVVATWLVQP